MNRRRLKRLRKIINLYLHQKAVVTVLQEYTEESYLKRELGKVVVRHYYFLLFMQKQ